MAVDVRLPDLGDGIESGDVMAVHVSTGDAIKKGQVLIEIETNKATVDVPSTADGTISKVHVKAGDTIAVDALLITLNDAGDGGKSLPATAEDPTSPVAEANSEHVFDEAALTPAVIASSNVIPPTPALVSAEADVSPPVANIPASPAIRRFAREVGVDIQILQGNGPNGRIEREDVLHTVRDLNRAVTSGVAPPSSSDASTVLIDGASIDKFGRIRIEKMTKIRKVTAAQMTESWTTAPRVTNFDDADITSLEELRQHSKSDYHDAGIKLTTMPFLIKAVATALRKHPQLNALIDMEQEQIVYRDYVNVGIAVDTKRGLIVPNIKNTDRMTISDIARGLQQLVADVRDNKFDLSSLQGGSFTISNLGAIGGTHSTPIINVPEVAILLVGRSRKVPVVADDEIVARLMMPLSLSYDHRLVDGATAAYFLNEIKSLLEHPSRLLMAT